MGMRWSLTARTPYTAGQVLEGILWLNSGKPAVSATGYILGQLKEWIAGAPIIGSQFSLRWDAAAGRAVAVPGLEGPYLWTLPPIPMGGYGLEAPFRLSFDRTDVALQIWLLEKVGDVPDPDTDPILSVLTTELATPPSVIEQMMPMIMMIMVLGMVSSMLGGLTK